MSLKEYEEEAEAATARLRNGLRNARSMVRDYKAKLRRKKDPEDRKADANPMFRFDS